jgi:hypothetical protein
VQTLSPRTPNRDVDMLFMIDNSASMDLNQASLIANFPILMQVLRGFPGGLPNLHLAVVTSNLGSGPSFTIPGCTPGGDGGVFRAPAITPTCLGPHDRYIIATNGEATKNYDGTIEQAFSCIANVGTTGCGFEHQLASAAVALGMRGAIPAANQGFLRPGAFLAVVFITNEDDCSAPPDAMVFDPNDTVTWGPLQSYRCNRFGHLCGGVRPPATGAGVVPLTACRSAEDGVLYRVSELATFFRSLKPDPTMVLVSSIAAPATPYSVDFGLQTPTMVHSCVRADGANGDPAVRMEEFVSRFGPNGTSSSICNDSYAPALNQLGTAIGRALGTLCIDVAIPDTNAQLPGIQANCQVLEHVPASDTTPAIDRALPQCDAASAQGRPLPCWYMTGNNACQSGVQMLINRTGEPPAGDTVSVSCTVCR